MSVETDLQTTPLADLHRELGARMTPFAGFFMPVRYRAGIVAEHTHTRRAASLFDVSHMGQIRLSARGGGGVERVAGALERLAPGDMKTLGSGRMRYSQFTDERGGVLDDFVATSMGDHLYLTVNAATAAKDAALLEAGLSDDCEIEVLERRAMLAVQGPKAVDAVARLAPEAAGLRFMRAATWSWEGERLSIGRSGYTGEDGFEISVPGHAAEALARRLLAEDEVEPAGLGARDSLRLEAGLCLYGRDLDETVTPVEAGLAWSIPRRRREEGGFPGAETIRRQIAEGPTRRRVGLRPRGRAPVRAGAAVRVPSGRRIGAVTSGGFGPTVGGPVAMGYVEASLAAPGTALELELRGTWVAAAVTALPFAPPGRRVG